MAEKETKMGRPPIEVDEELLLKLAQIHCTNKEICHILEISEDTLKRRFAALLDKGRAEGKSRLRRKQLEVAMSGNAAMLIFLGKAILGQSETPVAEEDKILPWSD